MCYIWIFHQHAPHHTYCLSVLQQVIKMQSATELPHWCGNAILSGQRFSLCVETTNCCIFISFQDLTNSHQWVSWSASHRFMRCSGLLMSHSDLGCQFVCFNTRDYLTLGRPHLYDNPPQRLWAQAPVTDSWIQILLPHNLCGFLILLFAWMYRFVVVDTEGVCVPHKTGGQTNCKRAFNKQDGLILWLVLH